MRGTGNSGRDLGSQLMVTVTKVTVTQHCSFLEFVAGSRACVGLMEMNYLSSDLFMTSTEAKSCILLKCKLDYVK